MDGVKGGNPTCISPIPVSPRIIPINRITIQETCRQYNSLLAMKFTRDHMFKRPCLEMHNELIFSSCIITKR